MYYPIGKTLFLAVISLVAKMKSRTQAHVGVVILLNSYAVTPLPHLPLLFYRN